MIESINNDKVKYLQKLKIKKFIDEYGKFLVEGFHLVDEAIKNGIVEEIFMLENVKTNFDGKKTIVSEKVMKHLTDLESYTPIIAVCKKFDKNIIIGKRIVILDGIQNPGNVGTIIRNAVAFNIDTIVFSEDSVSVYNDKVIRGSQGMIFNINIITKNIVEIIKELKKRYIKIYGTSLKDANNLSNIKRSDSYAIIFGNEGTGVKQDILDLCDELIKIEMNDKCESLNVGVSSGIILYYMR